MTTHSTQWMLSGEGQPIRLRFNASNTPQRLTLSKGVYYVFPYSDPTLGAPFCRLVWGPVGSAGVAAPSQEGQFRGGEILWIEPMCVHFDGGEYEFSIGGLPPIAGDFAVVLQLMLPVECRR